MALNWTNIQDAVRDAFVSAGITGLTVGWGPQPLANTMGAKPFAMLTLTSTDLVRSQVSGTTDELRGTSTAGTFEWAHPRNHSLSLNVYTDGTQLTDSATDLAGRLNRHLQKTAPQAALLAAGVRLWQTSGVRDLSVMLTTRGEGRAQCDYTLATLDSTADVVGWIETANTSEIEVTP
jgi:hypothetical protein